jgi:Flp pilus assembly protein TadG
MGRRRDERGSAAVELVLLTPLLVSLMLFVVALGRMASAEGTVDDAARDAARSAANARTEPDARRAGDLLARAVLSENGMECASLDISIDTSDWRAGGSVGVAISCPIRLADVAGLGIGGTRTITALFVEPLDTFRGTR